MIRDQQPKNRLAQLKQGLRNVQREIEDEEDRKLIERQEAADETDDRHWGWEA